MIKVTKTAASTPVAAGLAVLALGAGGLAIGLSAQGAAADSSDAVARAEALLAANGPSAAALIAPLEAEGYVVMEFEREDDGIEVEAVQDGALWELALDPATGAVLSRVAEDEDDDDDDDEND